MSKNELKKIITEFLVKYEELNQIFKYANNVMGMSTESHFGDAVYAIVQSHIDLIERLAGCKTGWLSWYIYENNCGSKGLEAGYLEDGYYEELSQIDTVDKLVDLMLHK